MSKSEEILNRLKEPSDRKTVSLFLSESIYADFKKACGEVAPSKVLEELMKDFMDTTQVSAAVKTATKPKKS